MPTSSMDAAIAVNDWGGQPQAGFSPLPAQLIPMLQADCWTEEEVLPSGDEFFRELMAAISSARRSVEMEVFIFREDRLGQALANSLIRAASRGVRVRVLLDGVGSYQISRNLIRRFAEANVELRFYHPLPWQSGLEKWIRAFGTLNRRNHRKLWIIDHQVAYLGSMNVTEVHCEEFVGARAWRDIGVRLKGPPLLWLRAAFESTWQARARARYWKRLVEEAGKLGPLRAGRNLVELNISRAARRRKNRQFSERISSARRRVVLVNPYFVPSLSLLRAIREASLRGVEVKIIVPRHSDIFFMSFIARKYLGLLSKYGVQIYEFPSAMLHAKISLIDNWVRVGSSNLNQRSLLHDLELNVILRKDSSLAGVENYVNSLLTESVRVPKEDWERPSWLARLISLVLSPFRSWM